MIEEISPKPLRTWTIFKNTDNTLEGIEALTFVMWQAALDEIEKESDNAVFMSDHTVKIIMGTLERLKQENFALTQESQQKSQTICELEQENKELKKQHYEALKMLKHEYDGRQRDNEQWFTRCTENHNEDSKIIEKYRSALEEIEQYMKNASKATTEEEAYQEFRKVVSKINEVLEK